MHHKKSFFPRHAQRFSAFAGLVLLGVLAYSSTVHATAVEPHGLQQPETIALQINQVALELRGPKTAVVEYTGPADAGTYTVLRDDAAVASGTLKPLPPMPEWGPGKKYFSIDFSALDVPGRYRVQVVVGHQRVESAAVQVAEQALFNTTAAQTLDYFKASRHLGEADRRIRINGTKRFVDVSGGWKDAGGDTGKYLSHLSYANFFNPQQASMVTWVLAKTYDSAPDLYRSAKLEQAVLEETFWGADFMHRLLDRSGYFYSTVFDKWGVAERLVTGFEGVEGKYTPNYKASFRAGGGMAIAALARASMVAKKSQRHGAFTGEQYLADAQRAFAHLQTHNKKYLPDGIENIIDDYTALMATTELYRATQRKYYLEVARQRAANLNRRLSAQGWFVSDNHNRPFYHGVEAGFPVVSLASYIDMETDPARVNQAKETVAKAQAYQLAVNRSVSNPYNYARQPYRMAKNGKPHGAMREGFFMPHLNETGYWWQGESARLASLATAATLAQRLQSAAAPAAQGESSEIAGFAQNQMDWILGRNPYGISMLYGFGTKNSPSADSAGEMVVGGISNGITGADKTDDGSGISFAPGPFIPGPQEEGWRWIEQWLPHSAWYLLAMVTMAQGGQ